MSGYVVAGFEPWLRRMLFLFVLSLVLAFGAGIVTYAVLSNAGAKARVCACKRCRCGGMPRCRCTR